MKARTCSIMGPDFVFILVISSDVCVSEISAWHRFGRNSNPSTSKQITSLHIIASNFGTSITARWFPSDRDKGSICICARGASGFSRDIILGTSSDGFISRQRDRTALVIDGKNPKFILSTFK